MEDKKQLIKDIIERGVITEKEINLIKRRLNHNVYKWEDIEDLTDLKITPEQTEKGLSWLKNKWKTPTGLERKNNPFGYREEKAIETFKEFRLSSFTNRNTYYQAEIGINNWIPVYDVIGKESDFQYILTGEVEIIG